MSDIQAPVEPFWGVKGYAPLVKKHWEKTESSKNGWKLELSNPNPDAHGSAYGWYVRISKEVDPITNHGYKTKSLEFVIDMYPACCAFKQLNHFNYGFGVKEEEVHSLLDDFFMTLANTYDSVKKVVINTVESQRDCNYYGNGRTLEASVIKDKEQHSGTFYYPFVHSWAKKQKGCIDTPLVNQNTGRIIHHMIVFPDVTNS